MCCPANGWLAEWAKAPLLPPPGFHLATTDPVQIRVWWTRWPRALIGAVIPSGVVVLDLDPRQRRHARHTARAARAVAGDVDRHVRAR